MNDLNLKILDLEYAVKNYKKELRRIKSAINKVEKIGLTTPSEILFKKEDIESILKERKEELKALKKVAKLLK